MEKKLSHWSKLSKSLPSFGKTALSKEASRETHKLFLLFKNGQKEVYSFILKHMHILYAPVPCARACRIYFSKSGGSGLYCKSALFIGMEFPNMGSLHC